MSRYKVNSNICLFKGSFAPSLFHTLSMNSRAIKTRTAEFFIDQQDILHIRMLPDVLVDELDVYDNNLVIRNLTEGKKTARLLDARAEKWSMTKAGKEQAEKQFNPELTTGVAILINSPLAKSLLNLFRLVNRNNMPVRYFTSEDEATTWLRSLQPPD